MATLKARTLTDNPRARSASLIAVGAFAIHQLRYLLISGDLSGEDFLRRGHSYLINALPLLGGLLLAALTAWVVRKTVFDGDGPLRSRRLRAASYAIGIVAVFCCQELIEGALLTGRVGSLGAIFSTGGWAAMPLAALFGLIAALIDRGVEAVEALTAPRSPKPSTSSSRRRPAPSPSASTFWHRWPSASPGARRPRSPDLANTTRPIWAGSSSADAAW